VSDVAIDRVEREDIELFIQSSLAGTGQAEFGEGHDAQALSLDFLHDYMRVTARPFYARCLALGLSDHAVGLILHRLLAAGAPVEAAERAVEGALIARALARLPPQRVYRLTRGLRKAGVNNRRTRAALRRWLSGRDLAFDALKYRRGLHALVGYAHPAIPEEIARFLFVSPAKTKRWTTPLLELWRRAHFDQRALFALPFTVAEGLAARRGIPRERLLGAMADRLTAAERARTLRQRAPEGEVPALAELLRLGLDRLCRFALSLPRSARVEALPRLRAALDALSGALCRRAGLRLPRTALIYDRSYSASGSDEKPLRPLSVALGVEAILRAAARSLSVIPTAERPGERVDGQIEPLLLDPFGATDLAAALIAALREGPDLVVIVSDGAENSPPGAFAQVWEIATRRLGLSPVVLHLNPVYDGARFTLLSLAPVLPARGLRGPSELPVQINLYGLGTPSDPRPRLRALADRLLKETPDGD
jgi:hypothetical protein